MLALGYLRRNNNGCRLVYNRQISATCFLEQSNADVYPIMVHAIHGNFSLGPAGIIYR